MLDWQSNSYSEDPFYPMHLARKKETLSSPRPTCGVMGGLIWTADPAGDTREQVVKSWQLSNDVLGN